MKLYSCTSVKDEEDIIEAFVRYNMNILDGMVISDNNSNDDTLIILKKLKEEGYNIDIIEDKTNTFNEEKTKNKLMNYTIKKYHPDYVFPLDGDEFICTYEKDNPRKIIESLDKSILYKYEMITYIITGKESNDLFVPKRLTTHRNNNNNNAENYKCFFSDEIYNNNKGIHLANGAHFLFDKEMNPMDFKYAKELFLAHFPVRSKNQIMNKAIIGRLNNISINSRKLGQGYHQYEILDLIIKNGTLTDNDIRNISKYFSIKDKTKKLTTTKEPINLDFCNNIILKYTKKDTNEKVLSNSIKLAYEIINNMREEKEKLHRDYNNVIDNLRETIRFQKEEMDKILNSKR